MFDFEKYPEFMQPKHLVELGLFANVKAAYDYRAKKGGPPYIRLGKKVLYPKQFLLDWINSGHEKCINHQKGLE